MCTSLIQKCPNSKVCQPWNVSIPRVRQGAWQERGVSSLHDLIVMRNQTSNGNLSRSFCQRRLQAHRPQCLYHQLLDLQMGLAVFVKGTWTDFVAFADHLHVHGSHVAKLSRADRRKTVLEVLSWPKAVASLRPKAVEDMSRKMHLQ